MGAVRPTWRPRSRCPARIRPQKSPTRFRAQWTSGRTPALHAAGVSQPLPFDPSLPFCPCCDANAAAFRLVESAFSFSDGSSCHCSEYLERNYGSDSQAWLIRKDAAGVYRAGGQGLPLNLTPAHPSAGQTAGIDPGRKFQVGKSIVRLRTLSGRPKSPPRCVQSVTAETVNESSARSRHTLPVGT